MKLIIMLLICAAFTTCGAWMVVSGMSAGWLPLIFFGLGVIVSIVQAIPGAAGVVVMSEGFAVCSLFRTRFYLWSEVSEFGVFVITTNHSRRKMIGYSGPSNFGGLAGLSAFVSGGYTHALPDTYGWDADVLAAELNAYRSAALAADRHRDAVKADP